MQHGYQRTSCTYDSLVAAFLDVSVFSSALLSCSLDEQQYNTALHLGSKQHAVVAAVCSLAGPCGGKSEKFPF